MPSLSMTQGPLNCFNCKFSCLITLAENLWRIQKYALIKGAVNVVDLNFSFQS
jgi:hypothetical protein